MDDTSILFRNVMAGDWEEVIHAYEGNPRLQNSKITKFEETALHVAISSSEEGVVCTLVDLTAGDNGVLLMKDCEGSTPLHLAAAMGSLLICQKILDKKAFHQRGEESFGLALLEARNNKGETPFFLAALEGHGDVFLFLLDRSVGEKDNYDSWLLSLCRRNDGESILHCTIALEDFGNNLHLIFYIYQARSGGTYGSWGGMIV